MSSIQKVGPELDNNDYVWTASHDTRPTLTKIHAALTPTAGLSLLLTLVHWTHLHNTSWGHAEQNTPLMLYLMFSTSHQSENNYKLQLKLLQLNQGNQFLKNRQLNKAEIGVTDESISDWMTISGLQDTFSYINVNLNQLHFDFLSGLCQDFISS